MALEVEPHVAEVRCGQPLVAALFLERQVVHAPLPGRAEVELQLGLVPEPLERLDAGHVGACLQAGTGVDARCNRTKVGQRADPTGSEALGVPAPEPGDEHEVVVVHEPLPAEAPEVADPAVIARPRICRCRRCLPSGRHRVPPSPSACEKPPTHLPVVRDVLGDPKRLAHSGPELDVHVLGHPPGDPLDLLRVEAQLQHVPGLGRPGELGVDRLVAPVGRPLEEVCEPAPGAVGQIRLVDDIRLARSARRPR